MSTPSPAGASEFDRAIALAPGDDGAWTTELSPGWRIADAVNGGLLLALAGNALRQQLGGETGHVDPLAISAYYLSAARPGPATVRTETVREGRRCRPGRSRSARTRTAGRPSGSGRSRRSAT